VRAINLITPQKQFGKFFPEFDMPPMFRWWKGFGVTERREGFARLAQVLI